MDLVSERVMKIQELELELQHRKAELENATLWCSSALNCIYLFIPYFFFVYEPAHEMHCN